MTSIGSPSPFFFGGKKAYAVDRSLRFNRADNAVLTRSPSSTTNSTKQTLSYWFKISSLISANNQGTMFAGGSNGSFAYAQFFQGTFYFGNSAGPYWMGNLTLRDFSAWYHAVIVIDTTLSTSNDRQKLYINGVQQERNSGSSDPSQNSNYEFLTNSSWTYYIGKRATNDMNFDGYMAEINFVQGLALDSSYFGETDSITGQWNPKKYTGSYGTNGFYLNFSDNSGTTATTLGKDSSGNGNNFTPNNFSVAAGAGNDSLEDTPTNNFCTLNPITFGSGGGEPSATLSNGNLDFTESSSNNRTAVSTFGLKTGKWYFEFLSTNTGIFSIGWFDMENNQGSFYRNNGSYSSSFGGGGTSGYASWTTNDIVGVAIDFDSGKIWYAKNNSWQSGDPATGNSPTNTFTTGRTLFTEAFTDNSSGTKSGSFNYGQRPFTYTPPTGYKSMCSANLPDPTINFPDEHFDTVLYTGNGNATGSQTNVLEFQPDWLWSKPRTAAYVHLFYDSVRGAGSGKALNLAGGTSPGTGGEGAAADNATYGFLNSFDANGFSYTKGSATTTYFNQSGIDYVVWNWNAGNTDSKTYAVKVYNFSGNNRYIFDDFQTEAVTLDLAEGGTYIFNMDDASNASHPFSIGTAANGTVYTSGITYFLDGVSKTYNEYTLGFAAATTRRLHITVPASAPVLYYWCSVHSGMGGQINTNSTLGSSNFDGTIQTTVKANPTAGFSIITHSGNDVDGATIGHGLGVPPVFRISKSRNLGTVGQGGAHWTVNHQSLTGGMNGGNSAKELFLNLDNGESPNYHGTVSAVSSTTMTLKNGINNDVNAHINHTGGTYVTYCFSEVEGYSKFGSYTGNGSTDGTFVFLGFRPALIIVKRTDDASSDWYIFDNKRPAFNVIDNYISPNLINAEISFTSLDLLSNGFKLRNTGNDLNGSGGTIIYIAFAESPFKYARAR